MKFKKRFHLVFALFLPMILSGCDGVGKEQFSITWKNYDGSTLKVDKVDSGEMPKYTGSNPYRPKDEQHSYTFSGWEPKLEKATADTSYTAQYKVKILKAKIFFDLDGGTTSSSTSPILVSSISPSYFFFDVTKTDYTFRGWEYNGYKIFNEKREQLNHVDIEETMVFKAVYDQKVSLKITQNIKEAGTVTGSGYYDYNTVVKLTTTVNDGYLFSGWYLNGNLISDQTEYNYMTWSTDATVEARYQRRQYNLYVVSDNSDEGLIMVNGSGKDYASSFSGKKYFKDNLTVVAYTKTSSVFMGWFDKNNLLVSTDAVYEFVMPSSDVSLRAKWDMFKVSLNINNYSAGSIAGAGSFSSNSTVSISATPNEGYSFAGWFDSNDSLIYSSAETTFVMPANHVSLIAKFVPNKYSLTVSSEDIEKGEVSGTGTYDYNSRVLITATPSAGYSFEGWYLDDAKVSSNASYTITMPYNSVTYVAKFSTNKYTFSTAYYTNCTSTMGTIESSLSGSILYKTVVSVKATPQNGYHFVGWYSSSVTLVSENPEYSFEMPHDNYKLMAKFEGNIYEITAVPDNANNGSVTGGGKFACGTTTKLTATPATGYTFAGWYENDKYLTSSNPYTYKIKAGDSIVTAKFVANKFTLNVNYTSGTGKTAGSGSYSCDSEVTVSFTPNDGYTFKGWYNYSNELLSTDNPYTFIMPRQNYSIKAECDANLYSITIKSENTDKGTVSGGGNYYFNESVTLTATPKYGYYFYGWVDQDGTLCSQYKNTFNMPAKNLNLTALFKGNVHSVYVKTNNSDAGYVFGGGSNQYNETVTVIAQTFDGYSFDGWYTGSTTCVSTSERYEFKMPNSDVTITAHFSPKNYDVNITVVNEECGSVTGEGNYDFNKYVKLTATLNDYSTLKVKYSFLGWYDGETCLSTELTYGFYMPNNEMNITAKFKATPKKTGETMKFGLYPQSKVTDTSTISTLKTLIPSEKPSSENDNGWIPYNWYASSSNATHFGWYYDIDIDEDEVNDYRAVYFTSYRPNNCQEASNETKSTQDDNYYYVKTTYFFKYEPITWRILDNSYSTTMMTSLILDCCSYSSSASSSTKITRTDYLGNTDLAYANNYQYSLLRSFLNVDFYNTAFTKDEMKLIISSTIDNHTGVNEEYICNDTSDKVFELSRPEANDKNLGFNSTDASAHKASLRTTATDYALCMGSSESWHLRTPYTQYSYVGTYQVSSLGEIFGTSWNNGIAGIRPAIQF